MSRRLLVTFINGDDEEVSNKIKFIKTTKDIRSL